MKKINLIISAFLFCFYTTAFSQQTENIRDITILHWNDFHSANMPSMVSRKNKDTDEKTYYIAGGTSMMLGLIKLNKDYKTLVLNAGDDFQGSPVSNLTRGKSQMVLLNLFNLDAFTIGNHEFDYGYGALDSALKTVNFNYLACNFKNNKNNELIGKPYIIKYINGIKAGIIGLSIDDLMELTIPDNVSEITILNMDSVITENIGILKEEGCDLIVVLSHNGIDTDEEIAKKYYGDIDIIIGGHTHTALFKPKIVNGVIICQAGAYGRWLGKLDLKVDIDKDTISSFNGFLIETKFDSTVYDRDAQEIVEEMEMDVDKKLSLKIGMVTEDWDKQSIGQWQADALAKKMNTEMAFLNSGGIRKEILKGDITLKQMWEVNPFGNTIVKISVDGKTLKEMIDYNLRNKKTDDRIILSGIKIYYKSRKIEQGTDFIDSIIVNNDLLDINKSYTISTNNYMANQLKKFFGDIPTEINEINTNFIDRDIFIEAIKSAGIIEPTYEQRIIDLSN
ncbi:MAG: bifunctional metallophosphatase/5'-nucleotidase [Ignavibacteria bacterium]|nr:bifunctional metallophosphatase/5'-nucleotidase [Ignavibacteria bacterium]